MVSAGGTDGCFSATVVRPRGGGWLSRPLFRFANARQDSERSSLLHMGSSLAAGALDPVAAAFFKCPTRRAEDGRGPRVIRSNCTATIIDDGQFIKNSNARTMNRKLSSV